MQTTVGAKLHKNEMKLYKFKKERKKELESQWNNKMEANQ